LYNVSIITLYKTQYACECMGLKLISTNLIEKKNIGGTLDFWNSWASLWTEERRKKCSKGIRKNGKGVYRPYYTMYGIMVSNENFGLKGCVYIGSN